MAPSSLGATAHACSSCRASLSLTPAPRALPSTPAGVVRHFAGGDLPPDAWFGQQAVFRISLGNFLLFGALALIVFDVRYKSDRRDTALHHGALAGRVERRPGARARPPCRPAHPRSSPPLHAAGHWLVKLGLWAACNALPFLLPNGVVAAYAWLARFGSPFFLLIQMVILLVGAAWPCLRVLAGLFELLRGWVAGSSAAAGSSLGAARPPAPTAGSRSPPARRM